MTLNYGLIGNCKTAALVSESGSIDWCCLPRFDSPSVFARILDSGNGGSFAITPVGEHKTRQKYLGETNILETTFTGDTWTFVVYDYFPRYREGESILALQEIHRFIRVRNGSPKVRITYEPRFYYGRNKRPIVQDMDRLVATDGIDKLFLYSDLDLQKIMSKSPITLTKEHYLLLSHGKPTYRSLDYVKHMMERTQWYWKDYLHHSTFPAKFHKAVVRSVLALKLLTHESGGLVAAPTTSLPEVIGGERNWDYRYTWLRDASFTIDALFKICHFDEAEKYINFISSICRKSKNGVQIMYGLGGETELVEQELPWLSGYKNSKPVRIGNAAYAQKQWDIYGEIAETFYLFYRHYKYHEFYLPQWETIKPVIEQAVADWKKKDSGIWEFRGEARHYTFSKVMCWVALDRGVKLAEKVGQKDDARRWRRIRDEIRSDILKSAWNPKKQSFVAYYGADFVDASLLLMPYFGFLPANHPKMRATIERCVQELLVDGFAFRYREPDDFGVPENAFTICTFWLIDALFMLGEKKRAEKLFRNLLKHANHVGLFSEDINTKTKELLGNFPQAYTHLALINTAVLLDSGRFRRPVCNIRLELRKQRR